MENKTDFEKISDNVTTLSGNILDVKLALDGIDDLLLDCTPQDKTSREQLEKIGALLHGVYVMAFSASKVACELEKSMPLLDDGDKNTK